MGRQWPLLSGRFWCLGAQVLQQHKQQHVRAQPGELRFQLTNLFSWQEPTFPCIKKKKIKRRVHETKLFSSSASILEPGRMH